MLPRNWIIFMLCWRSPPFLPPVCSFVQLVASDWTHDTAEHAKTQRVLSTDTRCYSAFTTWSLAHCKCNTVVKQRHPHMMSKGKIYKIIANLVKKKTKTLKMLSWTCYIWSKCHTYSMAGLKAWWFDPPQPLMDDINSKGHISQSMVMWCDTGCPEGRPISCWQEQRCIAASGLRSEAERETWGNRDRKTCWCWELRRRQGG